MIEINATHEVTYTVVGNDSARGLRLDDGDDFPDVLATARMVGLMELAAARLMRPALNDGELSVGVGIDVTHMAATPLYFGVRARATYLGREGKLYKFRVELFDGGGKVGEGFHTRAVVSPDRLIERARKRIHGEQGPSA